MSAPRRAVEVIRTFNRFYTQRIGALSEQHLGLGVSLGLGRVLFEVGQLEPVDATALQRHLSLDAGDLSRRLHELERRGLISRKPSKADRRRKPVRLTAKGQKLIEKIDAASDAEVERSLARLSPEQVDRVQAAMLELQRLLGDELQVGAVDPASADAQLCLNAYFAELERRFPEGFDPGQSVSAEPDELAVFLLLRGNGRPRGCGAVKVLAPGVGELKRMWIHPELRGRGVGKRLLGALEGAARKQNLTVLRLDTSAHLPEAIALYRSAGYREIPAYNDNPYAAHWFEKRLG